MASTQLELVNKILRRLRETEVGSVSENEYSTLIGDFVNQAKQEVEDAWNWTRLRSTIQVTTEAGTFRYVLTGAGDRFKVLIDPLTGKFDVWNDTTDVNLNKAQSSHWMTTQLLTGTPASGSPLYFDFNGFDTNDDPYVDLYPIPNGAEVINFNMVIPQFDLSDDDRITVPELPVFLRAYALAVKERGEDNGTSVAELNKAANEALANAIGIDSRMIPEELVFGVE